MSARAEGLGGHGAHERQEIVRESATMALYIAISLLAVLAAAPHDVRGGAGSVGLVWGTAVGLLLAHLLAYQLGAQLAAGRRLSPHERHAVLGQVVGTAAVATVATVPLVLADPENALGLARLLLAGLIGLSAYAVGTRSGARRGRAVVEAVVITLAAFAVALVKNALAH